MANRFGLSRYIPEDVKRAVRRRCGFGCAICGATITEYEHFNPDFSDALEHNPDHIVLLCPDHHALVTKGVLPKATVENYSTNPLAVTNGFSKMNLPFFKGIPSLIMGGSLVEKTRIPIQINKINLIQFDIPEEGSDFTRISANLRNSDGDQILSVCENEWRVIAGDWDFEFIGNRYMFKDRNKIPILVLRMEPPNLIAIECLRTSINGMPIDINEERAMVGTNAITGAIASHCGIGFHFS